MNRIFVSILLMLLFGCDYSQPAEINSSQVYSIPTACGRIEFRAFYFTGVITVSQKFMGSGYTVYPNLLRVKTHPEDVLQIERLEFRDTKGNVISLDSIAIREERSALVMAYTKTDKKASGINTF